MIDPHENSLFQWLLYYSFYNYRQQTTAAFIESLKIFRIIVRYHTTYINWFGRLKVLIHNYKDSNIQMVSHKIVRI